MKLPIFLATVGLLFPLVSCKEKEDSQGEAASSQATPEVAVKAVTAEEAQELLAMDDAPIVIDLRTPEEFEEGHIEGARLIDFKDEGFREELAKLDRNKSYLFHCRSGGRSTQSLPVWKELGFKNLFHLDTGILGWESGGGETVKEQ